MAKPAKHVAHRSRWSRMKAASLRTKLLAVTVVVIGVTSSVIGIATAYPIVEPYWYVSRGALRQVMDKQAIATDRQTLYQLKGDLDRANKDLTTAPSPTVRARVDELKQQIEDTDRRIRKATGG